MLTDAKIKKLPDPEADKLIPAGDRTGLYLRVRASGRRTWVTRRRVGGAWRVETLGDWPTLTALNARRRAATEKPRQAAAVTFAKAVDMFYREAIKPHYRSSPHETLAYLIRDCASLDARRLDRVSKADLVGIVRRKTATAPNAAAKLLAILKQFFRWAAIGELIEVDPSAGLTGKALRIPVQAPRERKLTDDELRALWALPELPYGRLLRFTLLTGCRIGEASQIEPAQIVGDLWRIPMTKNGKPHTLPLGATALALAAAGWPPRGYQAVYSYFKLQGLGWRPHDLRRTGATLMREAGASVEVIEAVLNHSPGKLLRTYQQPDMLPAMREALARLEAAVAAVVAP